MPGVFERIGHCRQGHPLLGSLIVLGLTVWTADVFASGSISHEFQKHAPMILDSLRARGSTNVGVLKFRVSIGGERPSDNVGTFNTLAARRLENALTLAEPDPERPIRLVRDASSVAAGVPGTTHLKPEGREKLFALEYPAAWGASGEKLKVDAFVTGLAMVDANLQQLQLSILGVFPGEEEPVQLLAPPILCQVSWSLLPELGRAFAARGATGPRSPDGTAAVELRVYYDGQPVNLVEQDPEGTYAIPEPRTGQRITLELRRSDKLDHVVGAVLKVNGENTAFSRQRFDSSSCHKWVLKPDSRPIRIEGYQITETRRENFRVATPQESRALEMNYGADVGMITLELFQEVRPGRFDLPRGELAQDIVPEIDDPDIAAIKKGFISPTTPRDQESLQAQLRLDTKKLVSRGVITKGEDARHDIELLRYDLESQPFRSLVLRYYKPGR